MSHFAKLDENNVVVFVTVGRQEDDGKEQELTERTGDTYKQTSYNTRGGVYHDPETNLPSADQSKAFRKNYAGIGYVYDVGRDAFIPPQPFASWSLNDQSCLWEPPTPVPPSENNEIWEWNEETLSWEQIQE